MSRTLDEIRDEMLAVKNDTAELSALEVLTENERNTLGNLDSTSKVAVWRLLLDVVAVCIWTVEKLFDLFKAAVTAIVEQNRPHNRSWYKSKALAFQYGHPLVNDDEYAEVDEEARVIKQAAVVEEDGAVVVKVATLDGEDLVRIEDVDVINAFVVYMNRAVRDAGTYLRIVNEDADELKMTLDVYYDPLLMTSEGALTGDASTYPVYNPDDTRNGDGSWDAVQDYLRSIDFDGQFVVNKAIDRIQQATGVDDVVISYTGFKGGLLADFQEFTVKYAPLSGYMKVSEIEVNYIASV